MLVLEIVAGRVVAPVVGASLYSWTSIIGVVLTGIAAGNYAGGRLAKRSSSPAALGLALLASGVVTWAVAIFVRAVSLESVLPQLPPLPRLVALVVALFFLPSALLGTVTPFVAQLTVRRVAEAGAVVGRLGAVSAAGSIAGTFLTGFVLIPTFGSRAILMAVGAGLFVLAVYVLFIAARWRSERSASAERRVAGAVIAGAMFVGIGFGFAWARDENACLRETAYNCIRIERGRYSGIELNALLLDRLNHGSTAPAEPRLLVWSNAQVFADIAVYQAERRDAPERRGTDHTDQVPLRALVIGGGSYTVPRYLERVYPGSQIDVVEIDPGITAVAQTHLGLRLAGPPGVGQGSNEAGGVGRSSRAPGIRVIHGDARTEVTRLPALAYDIVFGDAFSDRAVPWHLTTLEFNQRLRGLLRDDGIYVANIAEKWPSGRFLPAFVRTMRQVFPHVAVVRVQEVGWEYDLRLPWLVVGSQQPLDAARLEAIMRPSPDGSAPAHARVVDPARIDRWLAERHPNAPVLTDDYAPVDNLVAPLFLER
ncbi:MAG: fused MFS/spermidine synthase [Chloroflexi bacterium]|nr:fused MFS/spermidine synthase [Chloroflexota bacterium]